MFYTIKLFNYAGENYPVEVQWNKYSYKDLIIDIEKVRGWCKEGCTNYGHNGGCPPYSPAADELMSHEDFILLTAKLHTANVHCDSSDEKSKLMEKLLCNFMDSLGYKVKEEFGIDFLNPGHCRGCKPCTIETGCKAPEKRVYSITGVGIMLSNAIEDLFQTKLQWFTKDSEPEHVIKIMGFLSGDSSNKLLNELEFIILNS